MRIIIIIFLCFNYVPLILVKQHYSDIQKYRYNAIKPLLNKYKRPITILEIGANKHYLTFNIAKEYDTKCIIAELNYPKFTLNLCDSYNYDNVILLSKKLSLQSLERLGECEHFDVVLVFNIPDYLEGQWKKVINALLKLGDHIIIESPPNNCSYKQKIIEQYLVRNNGTLIARAKKNNVDQVGNIFLFTVDRRHLIRTHWDSLKVARSGKYTIDVNFKEKKLIKHRNKDQIIITPWHPGINLLTFKRLLGIYPSKECIFNLLKPLQYIQHNDLNIHNIIIQGKNLEPIDCGPTLTPKNPWEQIHILLNHFKSQFYQSIAS